MRISFDPPSLSNSSMEVADISGKVLLHCYRVRDRLDEEEQKSVSMFISEVEKLLEVSTGLKDILEESTMSMYMTPQVMRPGRASLGKDVLLSCQEVLEKAQSTLGDVLTHLELIFKPGVKQGTGPELSWPFNPNETTEKLDTLRNQWARLQSVFSTYQNEVFQSQAAKSDEREDQSKRSEVLRWYKHSDPEQNQLISQKSHEPNTGSWVFKDERFIQWKDSCDSNTLWLHGIPGAGKTILCSTIVNYMQTFCSENGSISGRLFRLAYFYFDFSDNNKKSVDNLLRSCIFQLASAGQEISIATLELYDNMLRSLEKPSVAELLSTFIAEVSLMDTTFLIIDGLDECSKRERQVFMENVLPLLLIEKVKLLLTSRKEPDIEKGLKDAAMTISIQDAVVDADIKIYVDNEIARDKSLSAMSPKIQQEISNGIVLGSRGMFRWSVCQLESMKKCLTPRMIRETLKSMPKDLDQTYYRILHTIPANHQPYVRTALHWLAFSSRPLLIEELAEASVIDPESGLFDPDSSRLLASQMIIDLCGVLVSTTRLVRSSEMSSYPEWVNLKSEVETRGRRNYCNKKAITVVSLSHYSVKEYLMETRLRDTDLSSYYVSQHLGNSFIAQCCLLYILDFNEGEIASCLDFEANPLLEYVARFWMRHWELAGQENRRPPLRSYYERLMGPSGRSAFANWLNIWNPDYQWDGRYLHQYGRPKHSADLFPQPLYWCAGLGDIDEVKALVERGADITAREGYFESAFGAAAFAGHVEVIEYFLQKGLDPNIQGTTFGNILQIAVVGGSRPVVQCLVTAGADVNAYGGKWNTPLIAAASKQRDDLVELLIANGAKLDVGSQSLGSALYQAAKSGDTKMTTILLGAGANVNGTGSVGESTPLFAAVESGSLSLVKLLLGKGADVNKAGEFSDHLYPLIAAADKGMNQIIRTLLSSGADLNVTGRNGETALEKAIASRDMQSFMTLVNAGIDLNKCSWLAENCFTKAVEYGEYDMAKVLIQRGANLGRRLLVKTVEIGAEPWVLEALLQKDDIDVDIFAEHSGTTLTTALHVAVSKYGNQDAVKLLLDRGAYVDPICQKNYTTPLCIAIRDGNMDAAELLIKRGADFTRTINFSPFEMAVAHACKKGSLRFVDKLLDLGVDVNLDSEMAPFWPVESRNFQVLRYLVGKGINLNRGLVPSKRASGGFSYLRKSCTPVQLAAKNGDVEMLQTLLDLGANIDIETCHQGPTLHYGIMSKNREVTEFLLQNGASVDLTAGFSSICESIQNGLDEIVPILLQQGADVNANERGLSPLAAAFGAKNPSLVDMLRQHGAYFHDTDTKIATELLEKGSLDELKTLFEYGFNPNAGTAYHDSVIFSACGQTNTTAIEMLLDHGADLHTDRSKGVLSDVCERGHMKMATFLLDNGAEDYVSHALVTAAGVVNNLAVIELLLSRGADVSHEEGECFSAVGRVGCQQVMTRLLEEPQATSKRAEYLAKALQRALWYGNFSFCTWLLDVHDAPLNHRGPPYGSPLQAALSRTGPDATTRIIHIRKLLERGADLNPPTIYRPTKEIEAEKRRRFPRFRRNLSLSYAPPLSLALAGSSWGDSLQPLAAEFLAQGAEPNIVGGEDHAPLQSAALHYPKMVGPLLDAGADINATGGRFGTALHAAASCNDIDTVKLLLARGADARISAGKYGSTLQAAAKVGRWLRSADQRCIEVMNLLVAAGADVHSTDGKYGSAVQMAAVSGNIDALRWLKSQGADIKVKGGKFGNAYKAALKNISNNKAVQWHVVSWLEQHYGREGWD